MQYRIKYIYLKYIFFLSILAWAAMEGKLEPIKFLAALTPDAVNAQGIEEMTPLHHASIEGKN